MHIETIKQYEKNKQIETLMKSQTHMWYKFPVYT